MHIYRKDMPATSTLCSGFTCFLRVFEVKIVGELHCWTVERTPARHVYTS